MADIESSADDTPPQDEKVEKVKKPRSEKQIKAWEKAMAVKAEKAKINQEYLQAKLIEKELKIKEKEDKIKQVKEKIKKTVPPPESESEEEEEKIIYRKKQKPKKPKKKIVYISESSSESEEEVVYKKSSKSKPQPVKKTINEDIDDVARETLYKRLREERLMQAMSSLGFRS